MQQPMPNPEDITDPITAMNMALILMAKAFKLNYSTPTNNNRRNSSNPQNRQIAETRNQVVQNTVQNLGVQNVGNKNRVIVVPGIANQNGNGNVVAARAECNANRNNGNQIRCYNYRGLGHLARNCTVKPRRRDVSYLQTQLLIAQKEEAGIQIQAKEFDLMATAVDLDEIEEVNANCILMDNLQQASTSGTQTDKAPVYDSDGSAEVQNYENCYNDEIFNMFTQEKQYTELLKPIPEPHQVPQNNSNVISDVSSVEQGGGTVEQHHATVEETRAYQESLFHNLVAEVEKVNMVNRKMKETNAELTIVLARYKNQEKCFEISQEKYDKLERCYQKSVYQEQCLTKKINALHLSFEVAKFVRDFKSLAKEADESIVKHKALELEIKRLLRAVVSQDIMSVVQNNSVVDTSNLQTELESYNDMQQKIERLQAQLGDQNGKYKDTPCVSHTLDPLPQKLENENVELEINPFKNSREGKSVPNKHIKASVRTNPITVPQPHVISKKVVNSNLNGFSSTGVDIITKTRRPQPRINTKNDRVPYASKSSRFKNKEVEVEDHSRNLLLSKNKKYMPSACNNVKLAIQNDKSEIVSTMSRATSTKSWLWHQRLSHLNFDTINDLARNDLVTGLLKFKYHKEHLCPSCEQGKSKRASHPPKPILNSKQRLHLLHMDLYGPMRIASIHGKRYVLVIVDDYSRYTWVLFLRFKDEAPEEIKTFLKKIIVLLQAPVIIVRTDNGMEFKNQVLQQYFNSVDISHQASSVCTPQQNGVVDRRNRTLVKAAKTMLIFSHAPLFLWAEAIATAKPDISFLHVFGALCYPKNDREDIGNLGAKGDIGFFIGYSTNSCAYRVYNRRTKKIMETINVTFDELLAMAFEQSNLKPGLQSELDLLFEAMYDDHVGGQPSATPRTILTAQAPQDVDELETQQQHVQHQSATIADNVSNAMFDENTFVNPFATPSTSAAKSSSS
ncbi:retrovirus-related pol polyprotein from transposon TNT 1-94 [Tanacetum coccineum]